MFRRTTATQYVWPKYNKNLNGNVHHAIRFRKYAKFIQSDKKTVTPAVWMSGAGHPWYHIAFRRKNDLKPDKTSRIGYDPVVQRPVLFMEKKHTGAAPDKLKFTQ